MQTSLLQPTASQRKFATFPALWPGAAHPPGMKQFTASGVAVAERPLPEEPLIDMRTLAAWLAISESTVRKWVAKGPHSGLVPVFIRVNGQVRFRPGDVREFLIAKEVR